MATCEACLNEGDCTTLAGNSPASKGLGGTVVCWGCWSYDAPGGLEGAADRIRERRRAASGPSEAPLSAEGRPIAVGDEIHFVKQPGTSASEEFWANNYCGTVVELASKDFCGDVLVRRKDGSVWHAEAGHLRHAAPARPEQEAPFRDRFGVPLEVGDWICEDDEKPARITKLERVGNTGMTRATVEGRQSRPSNLEVYWRKVNAPSGSADAAHGDTAAARPSGQAGAYSAQPPEPSLCWEHGGPYVGACPECVWERLPTREIPSQSALLEVKNQEELVARVEFDLKMLKLLGQGWSRSDLAAHLSRSSRSAKGER